VRVPNQKVDQCGAASSIHWAVKMIPNLLYLALIFRPMLMHSNTSCLNYNSRLAPKSIPTTPPQSWTTDILRVEQIDGNRVALDVALKIRAQNKEQAGTAVFILYRIGGSWMLENVRLFNVN